MKRAVLAFIAGLLAWVVVVSLIDRVLRISLAGYAAAEAKLTFTLAMMTSRLMMAALTSIVAGAVVGAIAPESRRAPWVLGVALLAVFIPIHVSLWHAFPLWYHLTFLLTLAPLIVLGARLKTRASAQGRPLRTVTNP
jgi:hypothetical protein